MNHKLNIGKQIKRFWPCQSNYRLYYPSVLVSNKVKKRNFPSLDHKPYQRHSCCTIANKYKVTHSPLRSITALHCFADMHNGQKHNKGKSVQVVMCRFPPWNQVSPRELFCYNLHSRVCRNGKDCKLAAGYTVFQAVITT